MDGDMNDDRLAILAYELAKSHRLNMYTQGIAVPCSAACTYCAFKSSSLILNLSSTFTDLHMIVMHALATQTT